MLSLRAILTKSIWIIHDDQIHVCQPAGNLVYMTQIRGNQNFDMEMLHLDDKYFIA